MYLTVHISIQIAMTRFNTFSFVLQECNDLILLHLGYLDYTYYIINIHFHGLEDQTNFNIRNIIFYVSITLSCLLYYLILFIVLPYLVYCITLSYFLYYLILFMVLPYLVYCITLSCLLYYLILFMVLPYLVYCITLSCLLYYLILFMILPYLVYGITLYCLWYRCVEKFHLIFGRKIISIHLHLHICQFFKKTMWMSL